MIGRDKLEKVPRSAVRVESSQSTDDTNILQVNLEIRDKREFISIKLSLTPLN